MRPTVRSAAALFVLAGLLITAGCGQREVPIEDVYSDDYLTELRETLLASEHVLSTQVGPKFYERPANLPPQDAWVELAAGTQPSALPPLLAELSELAEHHGEDVPRLRFDTLPEPMDSLTFAGSLDEDDAQELLDYLLDGEWQDPVVFVPTEGSPMMRTRMAVSSPEELLTLTDTTTAPLPAIIPVEAVQQHVTIQQPHMVTRVEIAGAQMSPEFMTALLDMDGTDELLADSMPLPVINVGYASSSTGYILRPELSVRVDGYDELERDEIRQRAEADGYAAMCEAIGEIFSQVPGIQTSGVGCRVNAVPL